MAVLLGSEDERLGNTREVGSFSHCHCMLDKNMNAVFFLINRLEPEWVIVPGIRMPSHHDP